MWDMNIRDMYLVSELVLYRHCYNELAVYLIRPT